MNDIEFIMNQYECNNITFGEAIEMAVNYGKKKGMNELLNDSEILSLYHTPSQTSFDEGVNVCYEIFRQVAEQIIENRHW